MVERVRVRLEWILLAIERIARVTVGLDLPTFRADIDQQWLVERGLEIISEASRRIPGEMLAKYPEIDWRRMHDIGNRLRHGYDQLDEGIIWTIATQRLPELKPVIEAMLAELDNKKSS